MGPSEHQTYMPKYSTCITIRKNEFAINILNLLFK